MKSNIFLILVLISQLLYSQDQMLIDKDSDVDDVHLRLVEGTHSDAARMQFRSGPVLGPSEGKRLSDRS